MFIKRGLPATALLVISGLAIDVFGGGVAAASPGEQRASELPASPVLYVPAGNLHSVAVIDTAGNALVDSVGTSGGALGIVLNPGGTIAYVTGFGNPVLHVIDTIESKLIESIPVGLEPIDVEILPGGEKLYVVNRADDTVSVVDAGTLEVTKIIQVDDYPNYSAMHPDGSRLYVSSWNAGTVSVIDTTTDTLLESFPVSSQLAGLALSPAGDVLYVVRSGSLYAIDTSNHQQLYVVSGVGSLAKELALHPTLPLIYVTASGDDELSIVDIDARAVVGSVATGDTPKGLAIHPDGRTAYVANARDGTVSVLDLELGIEVGLVDLDTNFLDRLIMDAAPVDTDADGVASAVDNCIFIANELQGDSDEDGIGTACDPDHNQDCVVNFVDLGAFRSAFSGDNEAFDYTEDGAINFLDLGRIKSLFFNTAAPGPGPSGVSNVCGGD